MVWIMKFAYKIFTTNEEQFILPFDVFYDGIDDDQETLTITVTGLPDTHVVMLRSKLLN